MKAKYSNVTSTSIQYFGVFVLNGLHMDPGRLNIAPGLKGFETVEEFFKFFDFDEIPADESRYDCSSISNIEFLDSLFFASRTVIECNSHLLKPQDHEFNSLVFTILSNPNLLSYEIEIHSVELRHSGGKPVLRVPREPGFDYPFRARFLISKIELVLISFNSDLRMGIAKSICEQTGCDARIANVECDEFSGETCFLDLAFRTRPSAFHLPPFCHHLNHQNSRELCELNETADRRVPITLIEARQLVGKTGIVCKLFL